MTRPKWEDKKEKTTEYNAWLDVRQLARNGDFTYGDMVPVWSQSMGSGAYMQICASFSDDHRLVALMPEYCRGYGLGGWTGDSVVIPITYTPCHFGGRRAWFVCSGCEKRAAIMYFADHLWRCRKCLDLAYPTQCESPSKRRRRRMTAVANQLTSIGDRKNFPGGRPKGMHFQTFWNLVDQWRADNHVMEHAIERRKVKWARRAMARMGHFF